MLESLDEMTTCPICFEDFTSPRSLPCLHSFCLMCLQRYCKDKQPGDKAQCPFCRVEFTIPQSGLKGLVLNFFLQNLMDIKCAGAAEANPCEVCSTDEQFVRATVFCVDCSQRLCERCSLPHKKMKGGAHDVKRLGDEPTRELEQTPSRKSLAAVEKDVQKLNIKGGLNFCLSS